MTTNHRVENTILVTGGAGYIGSHTCKALAKSGVLPLTLDNLTYGNRWAVKWGPLVEGDLSDRVLLSSIFKEYRVSAVIHFAAYAYVGESMENPGKYFLNNVANTFHLLDAMNSAGVKHIVFSSSCAVYGHPDTIPIREDHPRHPINPYGESKLFVEKALNWYGVSHGMKFLSLRYFNAAGADPEGEIGEHHDPETHLIPLVIKAALGQSDPVEIYGTDYPTSDGTAIRDYIHVTDLASVHVLGLKYLIEGGKSTALNLGTEDGYSVRQVIDMVEHITGERVPVREAGRRPGDPPILVADAKRARRTLSWTPRYSSLKSIVETAWNWHRNFSPTEDS